jgi:hypothetical protein
MWNGVPQPRAVTAAPATGSSAQAPCAGQVKNSPERSRACRASVTIRRTIWPAGTMSRIKPALCPAAGKSSCTRICLKTGRTSPSRRSASHLASSRRPCQVSMKGVRRERSTVPYPAPGPPRGAGGSNRGSPARPRSRPRRPARPNFPCPCRPGDGEVDTQQLTQRGVQGPSARARTSRLHVHRHLPPIQFPCEKFEGGVLPGRRLG